MTGRVELLIYPLVNVYSLLWKITILMRKSTISMAICNCYVNLLEGISYTHSGAPQLHRVQKKSPVIEPNWSPGRPQIPILMVDSFVSFQNILDKVVP